MIFCVRVPGFDLCERGHVVDRRLHVPHLVRVDHEHRTGRACVFPCERRTCWEATVRKLGLDRYENISYPRGLKRLVGMES